MPAGASRAVPLPPSLVSGLNGNPGDVPVVVAVGDAGNHVDAAVVQHRAGAAAPSSGGNGRPHPPRVGGRRVDVDVGERRLFRERTAHGADDIDVVVHDHGLEVVHLDGARRAFCPLAGGRIKDVHRVDAAAAQEVEAVAELHAAVPVPHRELRGGAGVGHGVRAHRGPRRGEECRGDDGANESGAAHASSEGSAKRRARAASACPSATIEAARRRRSRAGPAGYRTAAPGCRRAAGRRRPAPAGTGGRRSHT